jgi:SAM-dependent methyltransferase
MASLFKGLSQAQHYAAARPTYPPALYDLIMSRCGSSRGTCIDVGCGTGQATLVLANHFDSVIGIDPSATQLENAPRHPKISYRLGTSEEHLATVEDKSVSCIVSAQAVHWMDIPALYKEVNRVLIPGGVLALWTYGIATFPNNASLEKKVFHIYDSILGEKYWDPRIKIVEGLYRNIPLIDTVYPDSFVSERIHGHSALDIEQEISMTQLVGFVRSWSGYNNYLQTNGIELGSEQDPVEATLGKEIGEDLMTTCVWPVAILLSVKNND